MFNSVLYLRKRGLEVNFTVCRQASKRVFKGSFRGKLLGEAFGGGFRRRLSGEAFGGSFWRKLSGETLGRNFRRRLSEETFGGGFWGKLSGEAFGRNFWGKLLRKILGEGSWGKAEWRPSPCFRRWEKGGRRVWERSGYPDGRGVLLFLRNLHPDQWLSTSLCCGSYRRYARRSEGK